MVRVFYVSKIAWSVIFICFQAVNVGLLVFTLNYGYWFSQKWTYYDLSYTYKGNLITTNKDLGICDSGDTYRYCYNECNKNCDRFEAWYTAGVIYMIFEIIASVLAVLIALMLILDMMKLVCLHRLNRYFHMRYTSILLFTVLLFHSIGFAVWAGIVKLRFSDCKHKIDYSDTETVCGEGGAKLSLFVIFWLLIATPLYTLISFRIYKQEKSQGRIENEDSLREF